MHIGLQKLWDIIVHFNHSHRRRTGSLLTSSLLASRQWRAERMGDYALATGTHRASIRESKSNQNVVLTDKFAFIQIKEF